MIAYWLLDLGPGAARERGKRRLRRPLAACGAVAAAMLLSSTNAEAFCRSTTCTCASAATCKQDCPLGDDGCPAKGVRVAWAGACAGFSLNLAGTSTLTADQWTDAIVTAFETWADVDCGGGKPPSLDLLQLRDVSCNESEYDSSGPNANVVYFTDDGWSGDNLDGTLALTTVTSSDSGAILDADMAINSARHDFTVGDENVDEDLVSIVTHEVGHFIGIAHSPLPSAVMYYAYKSGTIRRALTADDIAAVCTIYPPGQSKTCDPVPNGGLATTCSGTTSTRGCGIAKERAGGEGVVGAAFAVAWLATRAITNRRRRR